MNGTRKTMTALSLLAAVGLLLAGASRAQAHCDTMDGPVVKDAQRALDSGDLNPVLKWISLDDEAEVREAFKKVLKVRKEGAAAKELADIWFFETVVRLHRASEGAPYTGVKPAGTDLPHFIVAADKALAGEISVDKLAGHLASVVDEGVRKRFAAASEKLSHASDSVKAGREFVKAYVEYVHYFEGVADRAQRAGGQGGHGVRPGQLTP